MLWKGKAKETSLGAKLYGHWAWFQLCLAYDLVTLFKWSAESGTFLVCLLSLWTFNKRVLHYCHERGKQMRLWIFWNLTNLNEVSRSITTYRPTGDVLREKKSTLQIRKCLFYWNKHHIVRYRLPFKDLPVSNSPLPVFCKGSLCQLLCRLLHTSA